MSKEHTTRATNLIVVGLGPGTWQGLTIEAAEILRSASSVYVRSLLQPSLDSIREHLPGVDFHSFDHLYERSTDFEEIYAAIVEELFQVIERSSAAIVYAVPGSPSIGETSVRLLLEGCRQREIPVRIIPGLSYLEPLLAAAGVADTGWIEMLDASDIALMAGEDALGLAEGEAEILPWRAPVVTAPLAISSLYDRLTASAVKLWLGKYYPDEHRVTVVQNAEAGAPIASRVPIYDLDRLEVIDHRTCVYVPPLSEYENTRTFAGLMQLTRRLRGPGGCPWDREQTHASLKPHLIEEAYEVIDALDGQDPALIAEELGDLLFQVTIHSQVAAEAGDFTIEDVIENIMRKLIGRHPHVFGDVRFETSHEVRSAWESFKQREKPQRTSVLEEIPRGLPALPQSNLMQKRVAGLGFEWPDVAAVLDKVAEELGELREELAATESGDGRREELGDIFFALVSVARHLRIDPEEALRLANHKFAARFRHIERRVSGEGRLLR
ncbi:MAG: nucleoside triphosphate pyrophosphohydrolase [Chloroflexota bacterium]